MSFPEPRLPNPSVLGTGVPPGCTSFTDYLAATAPHLLPGRMPEGIDLRGTPRPRARRAWTCRTAPRSSR